MRCMKCGLSITGTIADSMGHVCVPRPDTEKNNGLQAENSKGRSATAAPLRPKDNVDALLDRISNQEEEYVMDDLDREILLANARDFGEGTEQENRYARGRLYDEIEPDLTLRDVEREVPTDPYERAEFLAREMRFPSEQLARMKEKPLDNGLVTFQLKPKELDDYLRTGKLPKLDESRMSVGKEATPQATPAAAEGLTI